MASSTGLIVVTCASGPQCSHLIPLLYGKHPLRLVAISDASVASLRTKYPNADVQQADLSEPAKCREVVQGAVVVYHAGPSFHPRETEIGKNMIEACEFEFVFGARKFKHFVFSSVHTTQFRKLMNHDNKRYVEEYLYESTLNYTVLKPTDFLDVSLSPSFKTSKGTGSWREGIQPDGSIKWVVPWNQDVPSAYTALCDLAEVAAKVIVEREKHFYAEYPLCSEGPLSRRQAAKAIEQVFGRPVKVVEPESQEGAVNNLYNQMFGSKQDARLRDGVERLILFYNRRGLTGNPNVMRWLLGREPTSHVEWLKAEAEKVGSLEPSN